MAQVALHAQAEWRNGGAIASRALSLFSASGTHYISSFWHICSGKNFSFISGLRSFSGTAKGSRASHTTILHKGRGANRPRKCNASRLSVVHACNFLSPLPLEASGFITGKPCVFRGCRSASEVTETETEMNFATATSGHPRAFMHLFACIKCISNHTGSVL